MITLDYQISSLPYGSAEILQYYYAPSHTFSNVAYAVLEKLKPGTVRLDATSPEVIALRLLDYLSSKKGYIRRKSKTFRNQEVYEHMARLFIPFIRAGRPVRLNTICLCTSLCNVELVGESPYPHMASYLALENLHKILKGTREIYPHGVTLTLGYEGSIFKPMFFHDDNVIRITLRIFEEMNDTAFSIVNPGHVENPIVILDVEDMVEQAFGSKKTFHHLVSKKRREAYEGEYEWQLWYEKATSSRYFASKQQKAEFINEITKWRYAVHALKLSGGKFNGGFMQFDADTIPINISGRRSDRIALQLVPENPYVPHQRAITYNPVEKKWRMKAFADIQQATTKYAPRLVSSYSHPFYYEEICNRE